MKPNEVISILLTVSIAVSLLMFSPPANSLPRGSTFNETLHVTVDPAGGSYTSYDLALPEVSCLPSDNFWDCRRDWLSIDMLLNANATYVQAPSSPAQAIWDGGGGLYLKLVVRSKSTGEMYSVDILCHRYRRGALKTCNSSAADMDNAEDRAERKRLNFGFYPGQFSEVPDGEYTAYIGLSIYDWHQAYLLLNVGVNFDITVSRGDNSSPNTPATTLHALEGGILPINFTNIDENTKYGTGKLDFCLETSSGEYDGVQVSIVGESFNYPDLSNGYMTHGVFILANKSDSVTNARNSFISMAFSSRTLGMTNTITSSSQCQSSSFGFCVAQAKTVDLSYYPDTNSPTGGVCKRFDITATTRPFNVFQVQAGEYSSTFYLLVDRTP